MNDTEFTIGVEVRGEHTEFVIPLLSTARVTGSILGLHFNPSEDPGGLIFEWPVVVSFMQPAPHRGERFCWGSVYRVAGRVKDVLFHKTWHEVRAYAPHPVLKYIETRDDCPAVSWRDGNGVEHTWEFFALEARTEKSDRYTWREEANVERD